MTTTIIKTLNEGEKRLFEFKNGMSGGFYNLLFECIFKADEGNKNKLHRAFPEEVMAVIKHNNVPGYWETVQEIYKANL
jgi:hypothetical protein